MPLNGSGMTLVPASKYRSSSKTSYDGSSVLRCRADHPAAVAQHGGVEERLAAGRLVGLGAAHDDAELIGR